jgi:hypothetical protein
MKIKRTRQCAKCPWKKSTNPHEIPNGYDVEKHKNLDRTIAKEGDLSFLTGGLHVMACHETHDAHCIGWLVHQLGRGNNIGLRLQMMRCENASEIKTDGPQLETFQDTLP